MMEGKDMFDLAKRVARGRWFVLFVSFLIMSCAGGTYIFGLYSEVIKTALGYDQSTLDTLGFFKDLGGNVGIVSGLINEVSPPWVVLLVGAIMNIVGYSMIWLSVTRRLAKPKLWQMYLYICIGANSQTFANTGSLVTCVKNFPQSRGVVLGILKGFVGLSGAIFTQIYHAVYGNSASGSAGVILLLGWLPSAVSLIVMFIVRPTKEITEKNELKRFYQFLYIAVGLAGFLMVLIVVENVSKTFSVAGYRIVVAIIVVFLSLPLVVIAKAEMDKTKQQKISTESSAIEIEVSDHAKITVHTKENEEKKTQTQHNPSEGKLENSTEYSDNHNKKVRSSLGSRIVKVFKGPKRGDDFTIPQALVSIDMLILFVATTCGIGSTLTAIDNMGQIGKSLGYTHQNISTFVALISIWNFLGRVIAGFLSEILLQKYRFPRTLMMTIVLFIACIGHIFIAFALPGSLYVASIIIGLCFGAQWPVLFAVISELFGLKYYATLYNLGAAASPLGSYLLSVRVTGYLYDREARRQCAAAQNCLSQTQITCTGKQCFRLSFIIMTLVTFFGALISGILVLRTRQFYRTDIYAKFREQENSASSQHGNQRNVRITNVENQKVAI
jgi:hypothetical protein